MGGSKQPTSTTTVVQSGSSTSQRELTPEERELNQLQLERERTLNPQIIGTQQAGLGLAENLLRGQQLPGEIGNIFGGISPEVTSSIVAESLRDIQPQFQKYGLLDSGVNAAVSGRVAGDIRRSAEEYNIGTRLNLLNLALGGQAQVQEPILGYSQLLSQRLGSLGSTTSQWGGNQTQTTTMPRQRLFGLF